MLTQPQVQRYAAESGLRDIMIAEKEIVLTYLLQLLGERGILAKLAFKGGTCLRKIYIGSNGRFSTDLDFTGLEEHDHEDLILDMMAAFERPFHGVKFTIPDEGYYETVDGLSWGVNPTYAHDWNASGTSEIKVQVSKREIPTLQVERKPQIEQSYFKFLPFVPTDIVCLQLPEMLAEKVRACYQRSKARDIHDLGTFATRPLNQALIRRLVVLKLWQSSDTFDPEKLFAKFVDGRTFDWDDLGQLVRRGQQIDPGKIIADCMHGYGFLRDLTPEESTLALDPYQRESELWKQLQFTLSEAARE